MFFISYKDGSKGYVFWDISHQRFEIPHNVKFEESQFSVKETILAQPDPVSLNDHQHLESDNESDSSGLDLVKLVQPPTRPPSPGRSTQPTVTAPTRPLMAQPSAPPSAPPPVPWKTSALPDMETAPLQPPTP